MSDEVTLIEIPEEPVESEAAEVIEFVEAVPDALEMDDTPVLEDQETEGDSQGA